MLRKWIDRANHHFTSSRWAVIRFQPVLYLLVWAAGLRLSLNYSEPPDFITVISHDVYSAWLGLTIVCPMLALLSWFLIEKGSGRGRFVGMWVRLSSDVGVFTSLAVFHAIDSVIIHPTTMEREDSAAHIFSRYMLAATLMFLVVVIIRDMWTLYITEKLANKIRKGAA